MPLIMDTAMTAKGHFRRIHPVYRLVDVRFCPKAPNRGPARSVAFARPPVIHSLKLRA